MLKTNISSKDINVIIAHYDEDLSWTNNLRLPFCIVSKNKIPDGCIPNKGKEASSYLEYIIKNYNSLTDVSIFIHGHRDSWHSSRIDKYLNGKNIFPLDYYNINLVSSPRNKQKLQFIPEESYYFLEKNKHIIEKEINQKINIPEIQFRPAACFYVKKDVILKHSIEVYKNLFNWIMTTDENSAISSRVFEYCWHIIFTGKHIDNYLEY